jgi:hypothetical protein
LRADVRYGISNILKIRTAAMSKGKE